MQSLMLLQELQNAKIATLLLSMPHDGASTRKRIFEILADHPLKVKTMPSVTGIVSGEFELPN